ncbi:MAG: hypothetical protein ACXACU_10565 [Candidatus Hodarchaeales archaeon]|jgi:hypothetical protein
MGEDTSKDSINCEKYRPIRKYSHPQEFIDNLPYMIMIVSGAIILLIGLEMSVLGWIASGLFILYGIVGAFWIIIFVCPYCHYYNTRACPCGYGQIAGKLLSKKDGNLFMEKFKKHIPMIVPLWIIPVLAGGIFLILAFSWWMMALIIIFAIDSFIILPLVSRLYGCAHCPQKDTCPWMGSKSSKRKSTTTLISI